MTRAAEYDTDDYPSLEKREKQKLQNNFKTSKQLQNNFKTASAATSPTTSPTVCCTPLYSQPLPTDVAHPRDGPPRATGASAARPLLPEGPRTRDCPRRRRHIRAHLAHVYAAVPHERRSWKPPLQRRRRPAVSTASRIAPRRSDRSDRLRSPPILSASSLSYSVSFVRCLLRAADPPRPPPRTKP